ncbi:MAG: ABC transporter ATP-binding protein [Gammaproteobacteria bacterium]|nr:ABC transporter ATP-binding protein [Gammaproteobacteria bacterium]
MSCAIACQRLTLRYGRHVAVEALDAEFEAGSLTALVGPNGAGKSTLLEAIVSGTGTAEGRIECRDGERRSLAYLPQQPQIDRGFPISVQGLVAMGFWARLGAWQRLKRAEHNEIRRALEAVGLRSHATRPIASLSGGEFQRALFARIIVQQARLILLDEPFAAVDEETSRALQDIILRWHGEQRTVIVALHDLEIVRARFPGALWLDRIKLAHGRAEDVLREIERARSVSGFPSRVHAHHDHEVASC